MAKGRYEYWLTDEGLLKIEGWARDGLTDKQIACNMGIAYSTFRNWRDKYPALSAPLKRGKEIVDREVENSLLKRATGMKIKSSTYKMVKVDKSVLDAQRLRFLNKYKLEHPKLSKQELTMIAIEEVPTYERIKVMEYENELAPDVSAAIFWLKNRKPDLFRDQNFAELNKAQAEKAQAEVRKVKAEADIKEAEVQAINNTDNDGIIIEINQTDRRDLSDENKD